MMLSKAAMSLLEWLSREEDDPWGYDRELVHSKGMWMAGTKRIPKRVAQELLFMCCISVDSFSGRDLERWAINGTGRDMLVDSEKTSRHIETLLHEIIAPAPRPAEKD